MGDDNMSKLSELAEILKNQQQRPDVYDALKERIRMEEFLQSKKTGYANKTTMINPTPPPPKARTYSSYRFGRFEETEVVIFQSIQNGKFYQVIDYNIDADSVQCKSVDNDENFLMKLDDFLSLFTCISSKMLSNFQAVITKIKDNA